MELRQHLQRNTADFCHLFGPAFVLDIHQKHARCIGVVAYECAGETVCQVIFWKHDFADFCEVIRLIFFHPENLRCGKACKCNVCGVLGEFFFSDYGVQIIGLFCGTAVVPEDRRADDVIVLIQDDKAMHLAAEADAGYLGFVYVFYQLADSLFALLPPVFRFLLRPAWMREIQRILSRYNIYNFAFLVHQKQFDSGSTKVNTNKIHVESPFSTLFQKGRQQT